MSTYVRGAAFGVCVVHGVLSARQMFGTRGLSRWYAFSTVQPNHAIEVILGSKGEGQGSKEVGMDEFCTLLTEVVYGNSLTSDWDHLYLSTLVRHVLLTTTSQSGALSLKGVPLPTPPANVDPTDYARWFEEKWELDGATVAAISLDEGIQKVVNKISGDEFLRHLDTLYELQHTGLAVYTAESAKGTLNMTKVQSAMDGVSEQLPPMLDLGELPLHVVNEKERYTFPYHAASLMSLLSVASAEMPQSIGYVLLQECHWFNSLLCHVRQTLHELQSHLLGGERGMVPSLAECARALQSELVPVSWVHPNRQPLGHTLHSWVADILKRYHQLRAWIKEGKVPSSSQDPDRPSPPKGNLLSVWMGGLANPTAVITALRQEKSVLEGCLISQIGIACDVSSSIDEDTFVITDEGGMYLRDIYLEGASWDLANSCLAQAGPCLAKMPSIYIRPVRLGNPNHDPSRPASGGSTKPPGDESSSNDSAASQKYTCPVFMNRSRQISAFTVELPCLSPVEDWILAGAALLLDPGAPEDGGKKWPKPSLRKLEEPQPQTKDDTQSDRSASIISKSSAAAYGQEPLDPRGRHSSQSQRSLRSRQSFRSDQQHTPLMPASEQILELPEQDNSEDQGLGENVQNGQEEGRQEAKEDLELMTARSAQLEHERHQHSAFDYRDQSEPGVQIDRNNVNQNANPSVRQEDDAVSQLMEGSRKGDSEDYIVDDNRQDLVIANGRLKREEKEDDIASNGGRSEIKQNDDQYSLRSHSSASHHSYNSDSFSDQDETDNKEHEQPLKKEPRKNSAASEKSKYSAASRASTAASHSRHSHAPAGSNRTVSASSQKSTAAANQGMAYRSSSFGSLHQSLEDKQQKSGTGQSRSSLHSGKSNKMVTSKNSSVRNSQKSLKSAHSVYSTSRTTDQPPQKNRSQGSLRSAGSANKDVSSKSSHVHREKPSALAANTNSSRASMTRELASPVGSLKSQKGKSPSTTLNSTGDAAPEPARNLSVNSQRSFQDDGHDSPSSPDSKHGIRPPPQKSVKAEEHPTEAHQDINAAPVKESASSLEKAENSELRRSTNHQQIDQDISQDPEGATEDPAVNGDMRKEDILDDDDFFGTGVANKDVPQY